MGHIRFQHRWRYMVSAGLLQILKLKHHLHSSFEKSLVERTMQYIKDRTESFDDYYFPCRLENCKLKHVKNWLNLFIDHHNKELGSLNEQSHLIYLIILNTYNIYSAPIPSPLFFLN